MRGQEAQPPQAWNRVHGGEQVGQAGIALLIVVRVDVLAEQRDLANALGHETLDVRHDLRQGPAELAAADERHDAVRAHLVAATHDRNVGAQPIRRRHDHGAVEIRRVQRLEFGQEAVRLAHVEHVVELRKTAEQRLAVLHRHAPGQRDRPARALALPGDQLAELAEHLLLGVGAHRAGDEHRDIGILERGLRDATDVGELRGQLLAVRVVHLTADVPEMDAWRASRAPAPGAPAAAVGRSAAAV